MGPKIRREKYPEKGTAKRKSEVEKEKEPASKSSKMISSLLVDLESSDEEKKLPPYLPAFYGCRSVEEFEISNKVEEGTYEFVYRAKEKKGKREMVALKKLKIDREREGFPITSLREVNTLLRSQHKNIVTVREIVVGYNTDQIFIVILVESLKANSQRFTVGEVKCRVNQLLASIFDGIGHMHDNWLLYTVSSKFQIDYSHTATF